MKKIIISLLIFIILVIVFVLGYQNVVSAKTNVIESNWALRFKKIHDVDVVGKKYPLPIQRAKIYVKEMIYWAGYWGLARPEILPAIAEAEGNIVNRGKFKDGTYKDGSPKYGLGLYHMQKDTAKWLWQKYNLDRLFGAYADWKVIDPTEAGTCLAALYIKFCLNNNDNNYTLAIYQWNFGNSEGVNLYNVQLNHVLRVLGFMEIYSNLRL